MYLKQGDLFWGMDTDFVKEAMDATTKENLEEGQVVFKEGDPADSFYILVKGRIKLTLGEKSREVYVAPISRERLSGGPASSGAKPCPPRPVAWNPPSSAKWTDSDFSIFSGNTRPKEPHSFSGWPRCWVTGW